MVDRHVEWVASMLGKRGFTLVELAVTTVIIAIIAAMAVPSMVRLVATQQLNSSIRQLTTTLSMARSQAVLMRQNVNVTLNNSTSNSGNNFYWKPYDTFQTTDSTAIQNKYPKLTSTTDSLVFLPTGQASSNGTTPISSSVSFVLCSTKANKTKTINVSTMGAVVNQGDGTC